MGPAVIKGTLWGVVVVGPGDPRLVDREGRRTVGTTDPLTRTIHLSSELEPPILDRVLLHEVSHAVAMEYGLLPGFEAMVRDGDVVGAEEWAAQLMEGHAIEAVEIASEVLGRPVCVRGLCHG